MASSVGFSKIKAASKKSIPWFLMLAAFFSSSHSKLSSAITSGNYNTQVCTHYQDSWRVGHIKVESHSETFHHTLQCPPSQTRKSANATMTPDRQMTGKAGALSSRNP